MDIAYYLFANSYSAFSPAANIATALCKVNGEVVACPAFLNFLIPSLFIVALAFIFLMIAAMWKVYTKAGQPGWAAIIPIYNFVVLLKIINKPVWWVILIFIPVVSIVAGCIVTHELSKSFGKGVGFTVGLILLPFIFYPILGFGKATYLGGVQSVSY